jgi:hypothetical protein
MRIEGRITKLEERIPKRRSLEGLSPEELTDDELTEIICQGAGITPVRELTDEELEEFILESKRKRAEEVNHEHIE